MKRLTEAWFEFKGKRSDEMGIWLKQMPTRTAPGRNVTRKSVAGRNGTLQYGNITYKDVSIKLECDVRDESKLGAILAWLTGDGMLRFSDEPNAEYQASIDKEYSRSSIQTHLSGQRFTVSWIAHPFKYLYPAAADISLTAVGTINNIGTAPASPKIKIVGSGDFNLTIGMQTAFFTNVEDGIIIDSELGDALTLDGSQLANNQMRGDLFEIQPGINAVSWIAGGQAEDGTETDGSVTSVTITPRWRCF